MRERPNAPPSPKPDNARPESHPTSRPADTWNRLMLVGVALVVCAQVFVPPDGAPLWLDVLWIILAVTLLGAFLLSLYRGVRSLLR